MREWLYSQLRDTPSLSNFHRGRVFAGGSITAVPEAPFMVYRLGNDTDENLSSDPMGPRRQFFQVYVHDNPADYQLIDQAVRDLRETLDRARSAPHNILEVRYLETSRDLDDEIYNTIFRYVRFQAVLSR